MRIIKWTLGIGLVGCRIHGEIEVDEHADTDEIDQYVFDEVCQRLDYNWEE